MQAGPLYRVVLVDDDAQYRLSLKAMVDDFGGLQVAGEACDGIGLLNALKLMELAPDMVIVDISMPNLGGIEATSKVKYSYPDMKVLILTMYREKEYLRKALSVGADGYLLKEDADTELFRAIDKIRRGGVYISPSLDYS